MTAGCSRTSTGLKTPILPSCSDSKQSSPQLQCLLQQQQADRAHAVVARQVADTIVDEGRALLGPPVSSAHFRQLLSKMIELWDAYLAYDLTWTNPFRQQLLSTRFSSLMLTVLRMDTGRKRNNIHCSINSVHSETETHDLLSRQLAVNALSVAFHESDVERSKTQDRLARLA